MDCLTKLELTEIRSNAQACRNTAATAKVSFCRGITLWCKNADSRKIAILARLFDKDGAGGNQLPQQ